MTYTCTVETPLGAMTAAAGNEALIGLWFIGQKYYPATLTRWICEPDHPVFTALRRQLSRYFSGREGGHELQLAPQGSPFQKAVWDALAKIPFGQTVTYGEIAKEIARARGLSSMSAQAVGGAVGHNPLTILIPCHRVVGFNGRLTGYAGGLDKKEALLRLEGIELDKSSGEKRLQLSK
jgi:methylated-DNA-[protein]-cysteine S-methyltransferase